MPTLTRPKTRKNRQSLRTIQLEATQRCVNLLALLISSKRETLPSETTNRRCLTWTELARMANLHLDRDAPDLSAQTIKSFVDNPTTTRSWRTIIPVIRCLGYHAEFTRV